jgi:hypothetical protein
MPFTAIRVLCWVLAYLPRPTSGSSCVQHSRLPTLLRNVVTAHLAQKPAMMPSVQSDEVYCWCRGVDAFGTAVCVRHAPRGGASLWQTSTNDYAVTNHLDIHFNLPEVMLFGAVATAPMSTGEIDLRHGHRCIR